MNRIFDVDNPVWRFVGKLADVFILNLLWIVCCIPVVTIGAASTAVYYVTFKLAGDTEGHLIKDFFKSFRLNMKQATVVWLLMLLSGLILVFDLWFFTEQTSWLGKAMVALFSMIGMIYLMTALYLFPVLAGFYQNTKSLIRTSFAMAIRHLPWTLLLMIMDAGIVLTAFFYIPPILFLCFTLTAFLNSYIFRIIFSKYRVE